MKNNGNFKLLSCNPKIIMSHVDLEAIKHIVSIAPQEAQWFHRLEKVVVNTSIYYRVYEMYIPEQYTSVAQVESDPQMMYKFYKELKEEHGSDQANNIMSNLTAWCHSHHNMGVSPSGQDVKQFREQCKNANDSGITSPQLMMIFNKKNTCYTKLFDPELGLTFENIPILVQEYDFSHIDAQAKVKFKKPKAKIFKSKTKKNIFSQTSRSFTDWNFGYEEESVEEFNLVFFEKLNDSQTERLNKITRYYKPNTSNKNFKSKVKTDLSSSEINILFEAISFDEIVLLENDISILSATTSLDDLFADISAISLSQHKLKAAIAFSMLAIEALENDSNYKELVEEFIDSFSDSSSNSSYTSYDFFRS